jgi:hypothetical protein
MLVRAKKIVTLSVMTLATAVISLPAAAHAATTPSVAVLNPLSQGLRVPVKVALGSDGSMYVADQRVGGVVKFNAYGEQQLVIRTEVAPAGIAFAQDGALLVGQAKFVGRYDVVTGQEVSRFGVGQLQAVSGIAVDDVTGYVFVADAGAKQVSVFTAAGAFAKSFGSGLLVSPSGIAFEKISKQVVVADTFGNKVQFYDADGNYVKSIGRKLGSSTGIVSGDTYGSLQFVNPIAVAFEYSKTSATLNRMYVVDAYQGMVQVIDPAGSGAFLANIGSAGTGNGQLMVPSDVAFDSINNRLMVVNGFGNVTMFGIDGGKSPVDVTPPLFTVGQVPTDVVVATVAVGGTVDVGATVQVAVASGATVSPVAVNGTAWSAVVSGLSYGNNSISVSAKDVAGNTATPVVVNINYLLPAPAVSIASVASITNVNKIVVSGSVESGSAVTVLNQAASASVAATVTGGVWSCEVALAEGSNALVVSAVKAGSSKGVASASVTLDTAAPVLAVSALTDGSNASDPVQNISGTVMDANGATVAVNGVSAVLVGNSFSAPVALVNGANRVTVVATDAAGNTSVDSRTINYNAGPVVVVQSPVDNAITTDSQIVLTGTAADAASVTVNGMSAALQNGGWAATVELVAGVNTIEVVAKDAAGVVSSTKRTITFDNAKPALAIAVPAQDLATKEPGLQISGSVADTTAVSLSYEFNGKTTIVPVVNGAYLFNVEFASEGAFPITLSAKDVAGNVSTVVRNVVYDVTPPQFTLSQSNGVMPTKIKGSVEAGSTVVVKDGSVQIGTVQITNGEWAADLVGVSYAPENLVAIATDAAGNSTSKSLTYSFPDGTLNGNGIATVKDAMQAIKLVVNQAVPTAQELAHYDIGPLVGGKPNPNGKIEIVDAILILRKALGLKSW